MTETVPLFKRDVFTLSELEQEENFTGTAGAATQYDHDTSLESLLFLTDDSFDIERNGISHQVSERVKMGRNHRKGSN